MNTPKIDDETLLKSTNFLPSPLNYPIYDGNGNVSEYISNNSTLSAHFEYDAFGNTIVEVEANS